MIFRSLARELLTQRDMLHTINRKLDQVMTQASDNQAAVDADVAQLTKALGEIRNLVDTLNTTVADLEAKVAAGGTVDLTALSAVSQSLDDVVPDAPPAPTA